MKIRVNPEGDRVHPIAQAKGPETDLFRLAGPTEDLAGTPTEHRPPAGLLDQCGPWAWA